MRKTILSIMAIMLIYALCGCNRLVGGDLLEMTGMEFDSQIEMIEECLSIDLEDLTDNFIETIYSETDPNGNSVSIQFISLEGAGDVVESKIKKSNRWSALPLNDAVNNVLSSNGVYDQFDFEDTNGYFTISGVLPNGEGFDFDQSNMDKWEVYEIGIWDSFDETLYYISITKQ
ncbi:MAG: hypothetical protein J6K88_07140 [Oscillospiraceae bacterium]|nr:hypothetical protein [Oscillospiraceae bacterium]